MSHARTRRPGSLTAPERGSLSFRRSAAPPPRAALTAPPGARSRCALSKGWHVHHGVAKFAANSLTILCLCEEAVGEVCDLATTELLNGLAQWLQSEGELLV